MNGFVQSIKTRLIALGIILLVLVAAGGWWYMTHYVKTPEYTIKMVQEAAAQHDKEKMYNYVDIEHLLDAASNDMMDGLIHMMVPATGETRDAVSSLTSMFKTPVVMSMQAAVDNYIQSGTWDMSSSKDSSSNNIVDADMIVHRIGLSAIQFQELEAMAVDAEAGTAVAKVRVLQKEANEEYVLEVELIETPDGIWQVYEITNFKNFIEAIHEIRQRQMKLYLDESAALMQQHDALIAQTDAELASAMSKGSLGNDAVRTEIKGILESKAIPDWQSRRAELEAMQVPESAGTLHRLRLKICDARLTAAENYAAWMTDKKAATIRAADNSLKIAKTLEKEAELLTKQVNSQVK